MTISRRDLLTGIAGASALPGAALGAAAQATPGRKLNLIHIGVDTWGADWIGAFGNSLVRTPNVDRLLARSAVFQDCYPEVLPTLPCRRSIYTGRRIFPSDMIEQPDDQVKIRGWHQMYAEDVTLSETLRKSGYTTAIVSDLYHQFKPNKNFHRGFDSWRWIRGQEADKYETGPRSAIRLADYAHPSQKNLLNPHGANMQYLLNRRSFKTEDDYFAAQTFRQAREWLTNNVEDNQPFYLHIESFSPHEYWDPPQDYYRLYMKSDYRGPTLINPPQNAKVLTPVEFEHCRALYAGLVTFVDKQIGKLLTQIEAMGLMDKTMITFIADHGTMMGEQDEIHKGETRIRRQVTHVPFAIYHPGSNWDGKRIAGYVQHTDLMPTVLDYLGIEAPSRVTGSSRRSMIESQAKSKFESVVTGWGEHAALRTPEWTYIQRWSPGPKFVQLYDLKKDPKELVNVAEGNSSVVAHMKDQLEKYVAGGWEITRGTFAKKLA
ncbi:MAG TPA: sulfatase [Bryobacteraceae bacterium]|jgi:arylsulfatase A-like enzyme